MNDCESFAVNEHGSNRVEKKLKGTKEEFAGSRVEEPSFEGCWEIRINAINSESSMMAEVIPAEAGRVWQTDGKICEDRKVPVEDGGAESEVVREFMNGQKEKLIRYSADSVCDEKELQREEWCGAEVPGEEGLEQDHGRNQILGFRFMTTEFQDFGVRLDNGFVSRSMRFGNRGPEEIMIVSHCGGGGGGQVSW